MLVAPNKVSNNILQMIYILPKGISFQNPRATPPGSLTTLKKKCFLLQVNLSHVRLLFSWSVAGLVVPWSSFCHNFLKKRQVTLPYSYCGTCVLFSHCQASFLWIYLFSWWPDKHFFRDITGCSGKIVFFHNLLQPLPCLHRWKRPSKLCAQCECTGTPIGW